MRVPFGTITIPEQTKKLIQEILESGRVSNGKYVYAFEQKFARLIGTTEAVALSSGTDADALALAVLYDLKAQRGDEIILPALSFVATGNAVLQAGFTPIFVDINEETLNIDPAQITQAITKKTRAIMPVHLMGKPAEMDTICEIAKAYNLLVIEDAAEAHGARYKGKTIGSIGDLAAFSLYIAHIISTIEGGIITTNNQKYAEILRSLRSHGRACKCQICLLNASNDSCKQRFEQNRDIRFIFERIGFSAKMNELEAAVGLGGLALFETIITKRKQTLATLIQCFGKFSRYITTFRQESHEEIGPHGFPMILKRDAPFSRNEFVLYLEKKGVDTRDLFSSMPTQCAGFEFLGKKTGDFPHAEFIGTHGLHIGVHQDLTPDHISYFIDTVEQFLSSHA